MGLDHRRRRYRPLCGDRRSTASLSSAATAWPCAIRCSSSLKLVGVAILAFGAVAICNRDRGVPFALLLVVIMLVILTFLAKRTTFGRHVYAVGGNAEAATAGRHQRLPRPHDRVHDLERDGGARRRRARLAPQSVNIAAGSGTLLIDAISAAVIGGTSLFGGRGEVRNALFGSMVVATIANGLNTQNRSAGDIYVATGVILLLAVIARHRAQAPPDQGRAVGVSDSGIGAKPRARRSARSRRSASACSAMRSWARRTRVRSARSRT